MSRPSGSNGRQHSTLLLSPHLEGESADRRAIAASLLVSFLYGSLVWGVFPIQSGVSWETHLAAALIGLALAIALRRLDLPPVKRYAWEDEKDEDEDQDKEK